MIGFLLSSINHLLFTEDDQYLGIQRCDGLLEQVTRVNIMDRGAEVSKPGHFRSHYLNCMYNNQVCMVSTLGLVGKWKVSCPVTITSHPHVLRSGDQLIRASCSL